MSIVLALPDAPHRTGRGSSRSVPPALVAVDCPICLEPVVLDETSYRADAFDCDGCGIRIDWAPEAVAPPGPIGLGATGVAVGGFFRRPAAQP